jgi:hypothetical protein
MKRCLTCHSTYDDKYEYCENDGTPLINLTDLTFQGIEKRNVSSVKVRVVSIAAGIIVGIGVVIIFLAFNQRSPPSASNREEAQPSEKVSAQSAQPSPELPRRSPQPSDNSWLESLLTLRATPTPEESPTPEMSPSPSPMPTQRSSPSPVVQSEEPASTPEGKENDGTKSKMTVLRFTDGTSVEVDDAWRDDRGAMWYRRGGITARIESKRVKSIERPPVLEQPPTPSPTPPPMPPPTPQPTVTPTPTPKPDGT